MRYANLWFGLCSLVCSFSPVLFGTDFISELGVLTYRIGREYAGASRAPLFYVIDTRKNDEVFAKAERLILRDVLELLQDGMRGEETVAPHFVGHVAKVLVGCDVSLPRPRRNSLELQVNGRFFAERILGTRCLSSMLPSDCANCGGLRGFITKERSDEIRNVEDLRNAVAETLESCERELVYGRAGALEEEVRRALNYYRGIPYEGRVFFIVGYNISVRMMREGFSAVARVKIPTISFFGVVKSVKFGEDGALSEISVRLHTLPSCNVLGFWLGKGRKVPERIRKWGRELVEQLLIEMGRDGSAQKSAELLKRKAWENEEEEKIAKEITQLAALALIQKYSGNTAKMEKIVRSIQQSKEGEQMIRGDESVEELVAKVLANGAIGRFGKEFILDML